MKKETKSEKEKKYRETAKKFGEEKEFEMPDDFIDFANFVCNDKKAIKDFIGSKKVKGPLEIMNEMMNEVMNEAKPSFGMIKSLFKQWQPQPKTAQLIGQVKEILSTYKMALTVRQLYYQLVAKHIIPNTLNEYKKLDNTLSLARKNGYLDFNAFTDRIRRPIKYGSWSNLKEFIDDVKESYRKDKMENQKNYIEVWLEKDALAGIFEPITQRYDVNLLVGRGYQSLSSLNDASRRFPSGKKIIILYFGDFDPTGLDIPRSAEANLKECFRITPTFLRIALTREDIDQYKLPPAPAKNSDTRYENFIQNHGDMAVELDALPPDILKEKIETNIVRYLDITQFEKDLVVEKRERKKLSKLL